MICGKYGSNNVCIAGHSLGAGFALQVGKELAKEGTYVEAHLFNPPSVSLAMSLKTIGEKAEFVWNRLKSMLPYIGEAQISNGGLKDASLGVAKWVPYLYVNKGDYICCYYNDGAGTSTKVNVGTTNGQAKLFVVSKEKQKFLEGVCVVVLFFLLTRQRLFSGQHWSHFILKQKFCRRCFEWPLIKSENYK